MGSLDMRYFDSSMTSHSATFKLTSTAEQQTSLSLSDSTPKMCYNLLSVNVSIFNFCSGPNSDQHVCRMFDSLNERTILVFIKFSIQTLVPVVVMCVLYYLIVKKLYQVWKISFFLFEEILIG